MRTLSKAQMRILESATPAIVQSIVGLSGEALRQAMHPVWAQTITDILHEGGECSCQCGGTCFAQLPLQAQLDSFASVDDLSPDAFVARYEEACRQALGDTHTP